MVAKRICRNCGREIPPDAPGGDCPFCLLEQALNDPGDPTAGPEPLKSDEDLLLGLMAVQLAMATPEELVETMAIWSIKRSQPLAEHFEARGIVTPSQRQMLDGLVQESLRQTEGDASKSLEIFGGEEQISRIFLASSRHEDAVVVATRIGIPFDAEEIDASGIRALTEEPGRYTRTSEYSRGGMGRVLLVHDEYLMREILLKELLPKSPKATDESPKEGVEEKTPIRRTAEVVARFLREAQVTSQLSHPSIVPVYELGKRLNGTLYYTMKLVRGQSLSVAIDKADTLSDRLALLPQLTDICQAIAYAHSRNVIHRDLKPANIMLGEFGEAVVIDWGLTKILGKDDPMEEALRTSIHVHLDEPLEGEIGTRTGARLGTAFYMSPEQARGDIHKLDLRTDVYSLGVILYELLTGEVPIKGESSRELFDNIANAPPTPIAELEPDAPPELVSICMQALSKDANERYASAKELTDDLTRFQTGAYVGAYSYNVREVLGRYYRDRRAVINTAAAAAIALFALAIYSYIHIAIARDEAVIAQDRAESENYVSKIHLSQEYINDQNYKGADTLLKEIEPKRRNWEWGHLLALCNLDLVTLEGHTAPVNAALFSSDGNLVATASEDGSAKLWLAATGELTRSFEGHARGVLGLAMNGDETRLATASRDATLRVWDMSDEDSYVEFPGHLRAVTSVKFHPAAPLLASTSFDHTAKIWNVESGEVVITLEGHAAALSHGVFTADGEKYVTQDEDLAVIVWDTESWEEIFRLSGDDSGEFNRLALSHDNAKIMTAPGNDVLITDLETGLTRTAFQGHGDHVRSMRFSHDDQRALTTSIDGVAFLWSVETGGIIQRVEHDIYIREADFSNDDTQFYTLTETGTLKLWDAASGNLSADLFGHTEPSGSMSGAAYSPDNVRLLTYSRDGTTKIWQANVPRIPAELDRSNSEVVHAAFSPDGEDIISSDLNGLTKIIDVAGRRPVFALQAGYSPLQTRAAYSPDGTRIATTADNVAPIVFSLADNTLISQFRDHQGAVLDLEFSPDGSTVVSAGSDGTARIWSADSGVASQVLAGHQDWVTCVAFSRAGDRVATGSHDRTVKVWSADNGGEQITLRGHSDFVTDVEFSPDDARILTASRDGTARLWNSNDGTELFVLGGHIDVVTSARFSPDGNRLVTASYDRSIRIWNADSGEELLTRHPHDDFIMSAEFDPRGRSIATASFDTASIGTVRTLLAYPWRPEEIVLDSGLNWDEAFDQFKREPLPVIATETPYPHHVVTTRDALERGFRVILTGLQGMQLADLPTDGSENGLALEDILSGVPLPRIGFASSDLLAAVDGEEVARTDQGIQMVQDRLEQFLDGAGAPPDFEVRRNGARSAIRYHLVDSVTTSVEIVLEVDTILEKWGPTPMGTIGDDEFMKRERENERFWLGMGETATNGSYPGVLLYGGLRKFERDVLADLGLYYLDRVIAIDDRSVGSNEDLYRFVAGIINALETGDDIGTTVTVQRGDFQRIEIVLTKR